MASCVPCEGGAGRQNECTHPPLLSGQSPSSTLTTVQAPGQLGHSLSLKVSGCHVTTPVRVCTCVRAREAVRVHACAGLGLTSLGECGQA